MQPECVEEVDDVARQHVAGHAHAWLVGTTEPARVGREHLVALGEHGDLMAPHVRGLREAVQQHDRRRP